MTNVSATYTNREEGGIAVVNRGFVQKTGEWKSVEGKALFVEDPRKGSLKVSFFGPFYGGYHVLALDQESYQYAMVCGPNRSYLWILARQRTLSAPTLDRLTEKARELGFAVDELIYVVHDRMDG
jgi:apolipoprotein D and lipocalin family protein